MPVEPTIVPPVPQVNQTDSPAQIAHTLENVQKIFDKVAPKIRGTPTPESTAPIPPVAPVPEKSVETPAAPVDAAAQEQSPPESTTPKVADEHKLPSFIEKALGADTVKPETPTAAPAAEEWPEELPAFKTSDEAKINWKKWRSEYNTLKEKAKALESRPATNGADETLNLRLADLEKQNTEMKAVLSRTGVEQHREFQDKILKPMNGAWNEAARVVHEAGGDPQQLAKAMAMQGKAQYEALDEIFSGMPESAKIEANEALRQYKKLDGQRRQALANAPQTAKALQEADVRRQYEAVAQQKKEMGQLFDDAVRELRENAKVEVLQKNNDPDAKWWNEQADAVVNTARNVFLENTDMKKVAFACALAPMVDPYRRLWMAAQKENQKLNKIIQEKFGSEPNMGETGNYNGNTNPAEDLKKPFVDVFLKTFHQERARGVR